MVSVGWAGERRGGEGGKWVGASLISSLAVSVPRAVVVSSGECAELRRFSQCRVVADLPAGLARAPASRDIVLKSARFYTCSLSLSLFSSPLPSRNQQVGETTTSVFGFNPISS